MNASSRPHLDLDGEWALSGAGSDDVAVVVPGPWTTQVPGHGMSHQTVLYHRTFDVPAGWASGRTSHLLFGGVNYAAAVTLNGRPIGEHTGGWTPFEFEVTDALTTGTNLLEVVVSYPPKTRTKDEPGFTEVPHGKQSWYGTGAGIWQSVRVESRAIQHLSDLTVRADARSGVITAAVTLAAPAGPGETLTLAVSRAGAPAAEPVTTKVALAAGVEELTLDLQIPEPALWSMTDPALYAVTLTLHSITGDDTQRRTTGFRTIETQGGEVLLNGEPVEIRAVLDQDYHRGSSTIPESDEALEALFAETKRLGFNMLRCHIKRPDARYYDLADRMGLLVWTELPSWLTMTKRGAEVGAQLLTELIKLDGHHPSIVIWTVMNESWGIDLRDEGQRTWLRNTFDEIKALAPESLVVDNSACDPNFHLKSDLDDFHVYRGIPENRKSWDEKIADFAARPDWTYSPYGDAERSGDEPLILSEFGNWALPYAFDQFDADGAEPWWFATGAHWAYGAAEGTGLAVRFSDLGLDEVFGSWEALVTALHHAQMVANRYQTGSIRSQAAISGYVLTQLSDVQWEANGLFDMMRSPKQFNEDFRLINGEHAVVLRPDAYSAEVDGTVAVTSMLVPPRPLGSRGGAVGELRLCVDGATHVSRPVPLDERATHRDDLPMPARPGEVEIAAELWIDGVLCARDAATIVVLVDEVPSLGRPVRSTDPLVRDWLSTLGFSVAEDPADDADADASGLDDLLVVRQFDAAAQAHARRGGRVLVLAEEPGAFADGFDYLPVASLGRRDGDGDWVPRQEWLRRDAAFAALPGGPLLGIAYEDLLGDFVIKGIPAAMRPAEVHSALFSGWLRNPATTTATIAWSDGEATLTTFRVREHAEASLLARVLGRALVAQGARP